MVKDVPTALDDDATNAAGSSSSLIGATTAGGRSLVYQLTSFYLRTPLKLFRPARFDYLHYLRVLLVGDDKAVAADQKITHAKAMRKSQFWNPRYLYYLENSSIGLLSKGLNKYGWRVIPERVLPPLIANSAAGVVLYTTYLTTLTHFSKSSDNNIPTCHSPWDVMRAGFIAGAAQAIASAPIDAIYTRSSAEQLLTHAKNYDNLWIYGLRKLQEIGLVGCFGGFGLSLVKECAGFATYFTVFELLKGHVCEWAIESVKQYRELKFQLRESRLAKMFQVTTEDDQDRQLTHPTSFMSLREENWFHKIFVFVGGVSAALLLQVIHYPFLKLQKIHLSRLEAFDIYTKAAANSQKNGNVQWKPEPELDNIKIKLKPRNKRLFHIYYHSYLDTFQHVYFIQKSTGSTCRWLYKGFIRNTLAIIPGTTAGLLFLEVMRNKLGEASLDTPTHQFKSPFQSF
ncbi:LADA_0H18030g1_1 [Lachancea dasiensis]|uniref:LADA_0H18030g1_1 n=1 Tax=Lachancea dasiensis TaxID=1072105 RepID=A0A1G4K5R8_9SACH|nr:LADA_0H18030g1_1 [Lachancea dasiensis]